MNKRRPALIMSRNEYNISTNIVILCPITKTDKIVLSWYQLLQITCPPNFLAR
ncbi:type II toxin-antitoxin system PemK/MazF family toxin [Oceanobacillus sp. CAU 1775]